MGIDHPTLEDIPALRRLWQEIFGDSDEFLDRFFHSAFSPKRCLVARCPDTAAVLYWLDMTCQGRPLAYIYAVATAPEHRGRGLCRSVMAQAHQILTQRGYAGAVLVPDGEGLFRMYESMGYRPFGGIAQVNAQAHPSACPLHPLTPEEYQSRRSALLPSGGVELGPEGLALLSSLCDYYAGEDFLLAASREGDFLRGIELLGNAAAAPGILSALGCTLGSFRTPGNRPFAMFHPLIPGAQAPNYLGHAFD